MVSPLLLFVFLPLIAPNCIDWAKCDKATCFSKYANRDGLSIHDSGMTPPTTGVQLTRVERDKKKIFITVGIEVKNADMQDGDWAAIVVGDKMLAGCYKGDKQMEIASEYTKITHPPTKHDLTGDAFCCIVDMKHLNIVFFPISSAIHLALSYSSNNGATITTLPTDFSASLILNSLKYRENVPCDIKSFQIESSTRGEMPYYPFQDPAKGHCGVENHAIKQLNETEYLSEVPYVPVCDKDKKEWTLDNKDPKFDELPLRCVPRAKQLRRSCAGRAPPAEIRCGKLCGPMNTNFFKCFLGTTLHVLDGSFKWQKVDMHGIETDIRCSDRGYVATVDKKELLLSIKAKVQCQVDKPSKPLITFLAFPRPLAAFVGFVIYATLFTGGTIALHIVFSRWATRVEEIGPIRSPYGPVLSARATRNKDTTKDSKDNTANNATNRDESNRNTPSHKSTGLSGRSSKK